MPDDTEPSRGGLDDSLRADDSPWARDVPIAAPPIFPSGWSVLDEPPPDQGAPQDVERVAPQPEVATGLSRKSRRRWPAVAVTAGIVMVAIVGAQALTSSDDGDDTADASQVAWSVTDSTMWSDLPEQSEPASTSAVERLSEPLPEWTIEAIALSPRVQAITAPTEVFTLTRDGTLHVIDVPTGRLRSIATDAQGGIDNGVGIVVGDESVALQRFDGTTTSFELAMTGQSIIPIAVPGGVAQVSARSGTNQFVVMSNELGGQSLPALYLVDGAGAVTEISTGPFAGIDPSRLRFLPETGEAIITDTGGTYLINDAGDTRRVSTGDLVALGANHFVVRECDESLTCDYIRVDARSGERSVVQLAGLSAYREFDASVILSPDGSALTYIDWMNSGARQLVDLATGVATDIELRNNDYYKSTWAGDSSGLFSIDDRQLVFLDRATGESVVVAPDTDLGDIVAVATRTSSTRD